MCLTLNYMVDRNLGFYHYFPEMPTRTLNFKSIKT